VFAAPRSSRQCQPSHLAPVVPPVAAEPSGSILQPFPDNPLAVALRGSASVSLNDLLAWQVEDTASALELCVAQAAHKVTQASLEAAQAALEAAQAADMAAEARVAKAAQRPSANAPLRPRLERSHNPG
jgi:hypothetical protein